MPAQQEIPPAAPGSPVAPGEAWLGMWRFAATMTWGALASFAQLSDAKRLRTFWSTNLTEVADRALRSPEFLELLAGNLKVFAAATRLTTFQQSPR